MAFLRRVAVLADLVEMHDAAFRHHKLDDKKKALLKQLEQAVAAGKIDANLKESFKKFVTREVSTLSEIRKQRHFFDQMCQFLHKYDPTIRTLIFESQVKDAAQSARTLKEFDWDKFTAWVSEKGYQESAVTSAKAFLENWPMIFSYYAALYALRDKANALETEGEVIKKEKKDIAVPIPTSKYFKNFDFLKYYTPKMQQAIVDAVPEIEHAIDMGETKGSLMRKWDAIFNKHDKAKAFLGNNFYNLHLGPPKASEYKSADPDKLAIVNKDFAPVHEVFKKIDNLETPSAKEREQKDRIKREWSPGAELLQKRLHGIISSVIEEWKKEYASQYESRIKKEWDNLVTNNIKTMDEYRSWREKQEPKVRRHIDWKPNPLLLQKDAIVTKYPQDAVAKKAKEEAEKEGNLVASNFMTKNLDKLMSLLKQKKLKDIKVSGLHVSYPSIESSMSFTFEGDSSFKVVNKFVYVTSSRGIGFYRYPTTFHDVKVNGKPMATPSEYKVYMEFSGEAPPKEDKEEKETQAQVSFRKQVRSKYRY